MSANPETHTLDHLADRLRLASRSSIRRNHARIEERMVGDGIGTGVYDACS